MLAGPSNLRRISGSVPGLLDPSQPERLFRLPGSRLQFASFDPLTATVRQDFRQFSIDGKPSCRPKRIVIEITSSGDSFWRYVPNAQLDEGVEDEGEWPRPVEICGDVIECSQDQWDIYKLDPLYECCIRIPPHLTQITRATRNRARSIPKGHCQNEHADVRDDMKDVEAMDVDELPPTKDNREKETDFSKSYKRRKISGYSGGRRCYEGTTDGGDAENFPNVFIGNSQDKKRKHVTESPSILDDSSRAGTNDRYSTTYTTMQRGKRARTASSTFVRRELKSRLLGRKKPKRQRRDQDFLVNQPRREENLFKDLMADAGQQMRDDAQNGVDTGSPQSEEDEEVARRIAIEESRRKLAELEADKPLWEAAAKQRSMSEEAERGSIRINDTTLQSVEKERAETERKARSGDRWTTARENAIS